MQKKTDKYCFTLDKIDRNGCSGWFARYDGKPAHFVFQSGEQLQVCVPDVERPDVAALGLGNLRCGFDLRFQTPVRNGDASIFATPEGEEILRIPARNQAASASKLNKRLMRMVEPFVEMDIARVRTALMANVIYERYLKQLAETMGEKNGADLKGEIIRTLADMKTTLHLLSAAYLDQTRYKDPEFLFSMPEFCPDSAPGFRIEFAGDITGANWGKAEQNGRWLEAGNAATLMLPSPGAGLYKLVISVSGEGNPGDIVSLRLAIDDEPVNLHRGEAAHSLEGEYRLKSGEKQFLTLSFELGKPGDDAKPEIRIASLEFQRLDD